MSLQQQPLAKLDERQGCGNGGLTSINLRLIYPSISAARFDFPDIEDLTLTTTLHSKKRLFSAFATSYNIQLYPYEGSI